MTDGKEWVSIKIPESIRDPARDDPRTYGQIMQAGLENEPFAEEVPEGFLQVTEASDEQLQEIREKLEAIQSSASTAEERTGKLERMLEDLR